MKRGTLVTELYLVKLKSDAFSVPWGTPGVVIPTKDWLSTDEADPTMGIYTVRWFEAPGPGGTTSPIHEHNLEILGKLYIPLEIVESLTPAAKLERMLANLEAQLDNLHSTTRRTLEEYREQKHSQNAS